MAIHEIPKPDGLSQSFEAHRKHLRAVAYRMLGSLVEADDAVQEAWLRLDRSDRASVENLGGWLTAVVGRISLDMLRSRKARREELLIQELPNPVQISDPEQEAIFAESVGLALLVVMDRLTPPERLAFVLHDLFSVPFEEIALVVERTPVAARQLASRARRRVQGTSDLPSAVLAEQRKVIDRFLDALRAGDLDGVMKVLAPDIVRRMGPTAATGDLKGAVIVAEEALTHVKEAQSSQAALVNGTVGIIVAPLGRLQLVIRCQVEGEAIVEMEVIVNPGLDKKLEIGALLGSN